jgi:hypothetical protein
MKKTNKKAVITIKSDGFKIIRRVYEDKNGNKMVKVNNWWFNLKTYLNPEYNVVLITA